MSVFICLVSCLCTPLGIYSGSSSPLRFEGRRLLWQEEIRGASDKNYSVVQHMFIRRLLRVKKVSCKLEDGFGVCSAVAAWIFRACCYWLMSI